MAWEISFSSEAVSSLDLLEEETRLEILHYINQILQLSHPKQLGKALHNDFDSLWRYKEGNFRIICQIKAPKLLILVIQVGLGYEYTILRKEEYK